MCVIYKYPNCLLTQAWVRFITPSSIGVAIIIRNRNICCLKWYDRMDTADIS